MPKDPVRDAAIDVLLRVFDRGVYLDESLDKTLRRKPLGDRGRRFLTQLCYGTVRHKTLCDHALQPICHQPLDKLPPAIHAIVRMAVFQSLFCHQVTHPAMVHTSVELAKARGHAGLARMVNAILRRAPQSIEDVALPDPVTECRQYLRLRYSMPKWIVRDWIEDFGEEEAAALCVTSNEEAPLTIRVNTLSTDGPSLQQKLTAGGFELAPIAPLPEAFLVAGGAGNLLRSKAFQEGLFTLQDVASMLPGYLMQPEGGEKVLDLCAAPGGKTSHMAALAGGQALIVALEPSRKRIYRLKDTLERLGVAQVTVIRGDGLHAPLAEGQFDAVLVDAPCSGLGTLRRHPDLKWRMEPETVERLAAQQEALLRSAIGLCKNGGRVVYSVCTFDRRETQNVIQAVLADGTTMPEDGPELLNQWRVDTGQYRTVPTPGAWDGFFLTRLRKVS